MYSHFFLFYSSISHSEAAGGERECWLQPDHAIDVMTPQWRMAQSLDRTSPEAAGMNVEQPVLVFTTRGHSQRQNQDRKACKQGGGNQRCLICRGVKEEGLLKGHLFLE